MFYKMLNEDEAMLWTLWRGSIILWFLCCESFLIGLFPLSLNMRHGSDIKLLKRERMNGFRCHGLDSKHVTTSTTFVLFHVHFNFNFRLDWLGKVISIDDVKVMGELFILFSPFYLFRLICGQFVNMTCWLYQIDRITTVTCGICNCLKYLMWLVQKSMICWLSFTMMVQSLI